MTLPGQYVDPKPPATFAQVLASINAAPTFLLQLTAGITMRAWYKVKSSGLSSGNAYAHDLGDGSGVFNDSVDQITAVYVNGVALTQGTQQADVVNNNGYFFWDGVATQSLLISMPDGSNPMTRGNTILAMATMYFSDGPTDAGGYRWQPRISSWPSLSRQVTPDFSSITQVGGGSITLGNADHFFDQRRTYNWDAGRVTIIMGAAGLPFNQFQTLATFIVSSVQMRIGSFVLNLQDPKVLCDTTFPSVLYDNITYPNIDTSAIGTPVQVAYGSIVGASPVCIDTANGFFKLAGHAIYSIDQVRVENTSTGLWAVVPAFTYNLAAATLTLTPGLYWTTGQDVVVDFTGKTLGNGKPMINPADILQDLVSSLGLTTNTAGFLTAHNWYDVGYTFPNPLNRVVTHQVGLYIDTQGKALDLIQELCVNVRAYLQSAPDGTFTMTPFRSYRSTDCLQINDQYNLKPGTIIDGSGTTSHYVQAGTKISQCVVNFGIKSKEGTASVVTVTNNGNQYSRGLTTPVQDNIDTLFNNQADAVWFGQAIVNQDRVDQSFWTAQTAWSAWATMCGQGVKIFSAVMCIDQVNEILKVDMDLNNKSVKITMDNLRGFELSSGFWVNSTDLTPLGNSLAWNSTGELNDTTGEAEYRRQQAGHWVDTFDFAVNTTAGGTPIFSDADYAPSRWQ